MSIYSFAGLPFNLARNPDFRAAITFIANSSLGGYVPPGYNSLRTTLLDQEKKHIQRSLEPIKSTWPNKGVTIATDGWSDPQRRPILNFMAVTKGGPMFLKAIDTEGEVNSLHLHNLLGPLCCIYCSLTCVVIFIAR